MRKTLFTICTAITIIAICTSSITNTKRVHKLARVTYTDGSTLGGGGFSQTGCTAASGCHGTKASTLTSGVITGLPSNNIVTARTKYTLSVVITDKATTPTEKKWGFDMTSTSGLFTSTNPNVLIEPFSPDFGTEVHHGNTPPSHTATVAAPSYTFDQIVWTAPSTPGKDTFYYACNAVNGDGAATNKDHPMLGAPIFLTVEPSTTPVNLASFDASLVSSKVSLSWVTASEINTDHFEVERSLDGKSFGKIGIYKAKGNSSSNLNYTYVDNIAALSGVVFYRLKTVDKSGAFNYSNVKTVVAKATKNVITSAYPNPVKVSQAIKVSYQSIQAGNVSVEMVNSLGKKVYSTVLPVNEGSNSLTVSAVHIISGVYYLTITDKNNSVQKVSVIVE